MKSVLALTLSCAALGSLAPAQLRPQMPPPLVPVVPPPVPHPAYAGQPAMQPKSQPMPAAPSAVGRRTGPAGPSGSGPSGPGAELPDPAALAAAEFLQKRVEGRDLKQAVKRVLKSLEWHERLDEVKKEAIEQRKPILWIQSLGELDGFA